MFRKSVVATAILLLFGLVDTSLAANKVFRPTPPGSSATWFDAANWDPFGIPTEADRVVIDADSEAVVGPSDQNATSGPSDDLWLGANDSPGRLKVEEGGALSLQKSLLIGVFAGDETTSIFTQTGGSTTIAETLWVGTFTGEYAGSVQLTGGTIHVTGSFESDNAGLLILGDWFGSNTRDNRVAIGGTGTLIVDGPGNVHVPSGVIDITGGGRLILNNDHLGDLGALTTDGKLVTSDPDASISWDFNVSTPGKTTVWAEHTGALLGDVNGDGEVNGLDVDPFVDVLLNGPYQVEADMNQDTVVNGLDVDPFVAAVVGGGVAAVPEPSTLALLACSGLLLGLVAVRR